MFETQKHASFLASVTIVEIGNVPQLSGDFEASYEFLGKAPKAKDSCKLSTVSYHTDRKLRVLVLGHKQSVPDLKISTIHQSGSTLSLRSTSTGQISPLSPLHPISAPQRGLSSNSPPPVLTNNNHHSPPKSVPIPPRQSSNLGPTKKASDPTPLRQSIKPEQISTPIASPEIDLTDEPEEDDMLLHQLSGRIKQNGGYRNASSPYPSNPPVHIMLREASTSTTTSNSSNQPGRLPEARSGTVIDPTLMLEDLPTNVEPPHTEMTRSNSSSTTKSSSNLDSVPSALQSRHYKERTSSNTSLNSVHNSRLKSHRRGRTPSRPLKQHTCIWNYEVEHAIRINVNRTGSSDSRTNLNLLSSKNAQTSSVQVLGGGAKSESGLRISIEQVLPHRHASEDGQPGEHKKAGHGRIHFGTVHVDLAAFAGKGRLTRRFLLEGSKTNATVKVSPQGPRQLSDGKEEKLIKF